MSPTHTDVFAGVVIVAGLLLCAIGAYTAVRWDEPGAGWFAAFVGLIGASGIASSLVAVFDVGVQPAQGQLWSFIGIVLFGVVAVPWLLFALEYTGQYTRSGRRTVALLAAPLLGYAPFTWSVFVSETQSVAARIVGTLLLLYFMALTFVGAYLVLRTTRRYGHLSLTQGVCLSTSSLLLFVAANFAPLLTERMGEPVAIGAYAAAFVTAVGVNAAAVFRYDTFESAPAVGTIGERAIARETDDLVIVTDGEERVIKLNETAVGALDSASDARLGEPLESLLGSTVGALRAAETVELGTDAGTRKYDPQVSDLTDQHGRRLGYMLSLRDVTDRELREQRLEVLNRVLRHNLRNQVDVIRGNAEVLHDRGADGHAATIIDSADELIALGRDARALDRFLSRPVREEEVDLVAEIEASLDGIDARGDGVAVAVDLPEARTVVTDRHALRAVLDSAFDNAIRYAEASVRITLETAGGDPALVVADDGSGIPDVERAALDAGTETALRHGTGIGLWQLNWGVIKLRGDLSIDTASADGTTLRITVPDLAGGGAPE